MLYIIAAVYFPSIKPSLRLKALTRPESCRSLCQLPGMVPPAPRCACDPAGTTDARDPDKCWHLLLDQHEVVCVCERQEGGLWQIRNRQHLVFCF